MKSCLYLLAVCCTFSAQAQSETADTIVAQELHEIVIEAPKVIRKADMDLYHPSRSAVENSKNGIQLLNNLMIPALNVSEALGTVQSGGKQVQLRINGRETSVDQVKNLLPETIKRVEWIDNPGLRYKGASHVLNFIVANPSVGGSLMAFARPALNQRWGKYDASVKLNKGRSQWDAGVDFKLTDKMKGHRDYFESFTYPDGSKLTRTEKPVGGDISNTQGAAWLAYNYIKPDTTVFYASLRANRDFKNRSHYHGILILSDGSDDIDLTDIQGSEGTRPSFNLYLEQHFAHRQILVVDFGASMYLGSRYSDYLEKMPGATDHITAVYTHVRDRNQAYAVEANYIKNWRTSKFTAGASYTANRNRSTYRNLD